MTIARFKSRMARPGTVEAGTDYANAAQGDEMVLECSPHPRLRWTRRSPDRGERTKYVPVDNLLFYELE